MVRAFGMGLVAGARSMLPLSAVALGARAGNLPADTSAPAFLRSGALALPLTLLAAAEIVGDKLSWAPDRTIAPAILARTLTAALAARALAPERDRRRAGWAAVTGALVGAYGGLALRRRAVRSVGRVRSGALEDVIALGTAITLVRSARGT